MTRSRMKVAFLNGPCFYLLAITIESMSTSRLIIITGAACGLGRLLAERFIASGDRVAAVDLDQNTLDAAAKALGSLYVPVLIDLADPEAIQKGFSDIEVQFGPTDILINNAGIVAGRHLLELTTADIRTTFAVNVESHFHTTRAVLPAMIERGKGHIVTIASAGGIAATARISAYSSSKFAAVGFDDALRVELRRLGHPIDTTLVAPFFIDTGMFAGVRTRFPRLLPILTPEYAVGRIMKAIQKKKRRLLMPRLVYATYPLRLLPVSWYDAIADLLGVTRSMDDFRGRSGPSEPQ